LVAKCSYHASHAERQRAPVIIAIIVICLKGLAERLKTLSAVGLTVDVVVIIHVVKQL